MMSEVEATIYPDPVLGDRDIGLRVYRPLARLGYSLIFVHFQIQEERERRKELLMESKSKDREESGTRWDCVKIPLNT